jgi:hypothetical protein
MKTAVEFLIKELQLDVFANDEEMATIIKAKEMEKEQIMRTARQCYFEGVRKRAKTTEELIEYAEQYYNETFKQQEQ